MKELTPGDRPREKLLAHGAAALGDNELVALVLGSGCRDRDALDARDRANTAAKDTIARKAEARDATDRLLHNAALAIVDARAKLRGAETSRRSPKLVAGVRRDVAEAENHVQEARTAFDNGEYLDAQKLLVASTLRLSDSVLALDSAGLAAKRKNLPQARGK